ncbi:MAG TPA: hypothetical protein VFD51_01110 [Patescibacteria group bacterium]|nr:hypothetical protein [Patescibacteria group bacterium]
MKIICIFLFFFFSINVFAQSDNSKKKDVKLTSLSLSSGQGPLSSGIFFEANFLVKNKDLFNVSLGEKDMYALYLKSFSPNNNLMIGPSIEYYYNIPTIGIMAVISPINGAFSLSGMTWGGISAGNPEEKVELLNWRYLFFWQSVTASYKNFSLTAAILNFDYNWGHLFDFKYIQPINKEFSIFSSAGYSFFADGQALLKIGITFKPSK